MASLTDLRRGSSVIVRTLVMVALALVCLLPIYWMLVTGTVPTSELYRRKPLLFPNLDGFGAFVDVFRTSQMGRWLWNSFVIAFGTTALTLLIGVRAGYAMSRFRFRGRGVAGAALFVTQMLPEALLVVPIYALFSTVGLINKLEGLVLVNFAFVLPIVVWLVKSAVDGVPKELEEAAAVDGCPPAALHKLIVTPIIRPSIAAGAVLAFFSAWNEYLFAVTFSSSDRTTPASVGLASFIGEYQTQMNMVMAGSLMYALPAIAFFVILQRHVVSGLATGAVKG